MIDQNSPVETGSPFLFLGSFMQPNNMQLFRQDGSATVARPTGQVMPNLFLDKVISENGSILCTHTALLMSINGTIFFLLKYWIPIQSQYFTLTIEFVS